MKKLYQRRTKLSYRITVIILVITVLQLLCSLLLYTQTYKSQRDDVIRLGQQMLHQANSNYFSYIIKNISNATRDIFYDSAFWNKTTSDAIASENSDFFNILASKYQSIPNLDSVYLYSSRSDKFYVMDELSFNGIPVKTIGNSIFTSSYEKLDDSNWFNAAIRKKGQAAISCDTNYRAESENMLCISRYIKYPLLDADYYYVVTFNMSHEQIDELSKQICSEGETLLVADEEFNILYDSNGKGQEYYASLISMLDEEGEPSRSFQMELDGQSDIVITDMSESTNLTMIKIIPEDEILGDLKKQVSFGTIVTFAICLAGFLFCIVTVNKTTEPIESLAKRMRHYKQNEKYDDDVLEKRQDEIGVLYRSFNEMNDSMNTLINTVYETQINEKQAKLEALQAQLDPHFLYNTLQIISGIAIEREVPEIEEINNALSKILRYSLNNQKTTVLLSEELQIVEYYMTIQRFRYEDRVKLTVTLSDEALRTFVPVFSLQLGVENAIKHGMEGSTDLVEIRLYDVPYEDCIILVVENDGKKIEVDQLKIIRDNLEKGYKTASSVYNKGLINLNDRIKQHFGDNYGIDIDSVEKSTKLLIKVPKGAKP